MTFGGFPRLTRRRFLALSAGALCVPQAHSQEASSVTQWRGTALGASASVQLVGVDPTQATKILIGVQRELRRLEEVFSLYRPSSQLSRLNRDGVLTAPAPELYDLLRLCDRLHLDTDGVFDPTVQPLFALYAQAAAQGQRPTAQQIAAARARVGWTHLRLDPDRITMAHPEGQLTLNGIAQGYISDRIADWLRAQGLRDVLVNAGEIVARGRDAQARAWRCRIIDAAGLPRHEIQLSDRALATSAPGALTLAGAPHVFHPGDGPSPAPARVTSISAPTAALADGLSTALCLLPEDRHDAVIAAFPGARIEFSA